VMQTSRPHPLPSAPSPEAPLLLFAASALAAIKPSNPPPSLNAKGEKSWSRIRRPLTSVVPFADSDRTQERKPLPVQASSMGGAGDADVEKALAVRGRIEGSRLYTEKSNVLELGIHSGLSSQTCSAVIDQ
jgi:hypothetical protein